MPTLNQYLKTNIRLKKSKKCKVKALEKCPQKSGICLKVFKTNPKKPNSAQRRVAKITLSTSRVVNCYIPGEKNNYLQKHSHLLIRGGRVRDIPGMRYRAIRGKLDLKSQVFRTKARSKCGTPNPYKIIK